jgi:hypothetical protein
MIPTEIKFFNHLTMYVEVILKLRFLIDSGFCIAPSPSTILKEPKVFGNLI